MDFGKLSNKTPNKKIHPIEIYADLDRKTEAGPLRSVQEEILNNWFSNFQDKRDVILKLHTGQGKTLIGLLILQSLLNQEKGPCLYVCPNVYLVNQTIEQAKKFGISYCLMEGTDIPLEFLKSKEILICHVQKIFHGFTKFGLNNRSIVPGGIILDDSHACIESIKEAFTIKLPSENKLYSKIIELFEESLEKQGKGTFEEILSGEHNSFLPIPYWDWIDKSHQVTSLLAGSRDDDSIRFKWPLIKDSIDHCQAFVSGNSVEIAPYIPAIAQFGTFDRSSHRILMSATTMNDSFFIKGLNISKQAVKNPLIIENERWSGEKMILIPSMMNEALGRTAVINAYATIFERRNFGIVALVPSFKHSKIYEQQGCIVAYRNTIDSELEKLKKGRFDKPLIIVNRYDGIDLPDETCRLLIIDSKPYSESLSDNYEEVCREESSLTHIKIAQKIEQGLGRSVRGEKDFSAILLIGGDLINFVRDPRTREFFSIQTRTQIEIGYTIAEKAFEGLDPKTTDLISTTTEIIRQCISKRDSGWKEYYKEVMDKQDYSGSPVDITDTLEAEKKAEELNFNGQHKEAANLIQKFIEENGFSKSEHGWYLQMMARIKYYYDIAESNQLQTIAFRKNRALLKPKDGYFYKPITLINTTRVERIKKFIAQFGSHEELYIRLKEIEGSLNFEETSNHFEEGIKALGESLGFESQRPDNDDREGPDNLWALDNNDFLLIECKNEVKEDKEEISKKDIGQMNTNCGWFKNKYPGVEFKPVMIIQTRNVSTATPFNFDVEILRKNGLKTIREKFRAFYDGLKGYELNALSDELVSRMLVAHELDKKSLKEKYFEKIRKTARK
jgi:replicative superfamily II helicase